MKSNISENFSIEELSSRNNQSASHFTYLFRKTTGMSPLEYFIRLKLQRASILLLTTNIKIKVIAEELGYNDPYYFSRLFKKYTHFSPEQYRLTVKRTNTV